MKIINLDECNEVIKGYFKSLIDKGQQDVDVVDASAELIDVINEIPPAGVLIDMPDENDTFFEDFNNAYRKADVPEMQKQMISIAEDEERFNAVYKESVKMVMLMINEIEQYQAIGTLEELKVLKANERNCKECAGCTMWNCDCANERAKAIDDFVERITLPLTEEDIARIVEELKGGAV